MIKKDDRVIYNGNREKDYIGKEATVVKCGENFVTIQFDDGHQYSGARISNLQAVNCSNENCCSGGSAIAWGLRNKETGEISKLTFATRDEAKEGRGEGWTVIKVEIKEVK